MTGGLASAIPYSSTFGNIGKNQSYSVFADGTWMPSEALEVTAGIRALIEKRRSGYYADVPGSVLTGGPSLIPGQVDTGGETFWSEDSFKAFLPRFNILYRFGDGIKLASDELGRDRAERDRGDDQAGICPTSSHGVVIYTIRRAASSLFKARAIRVH